MNVSDIAKEIKHKGLSPELENELLHLLNKRKHDIEKLRSNFNSKRNPKYFMKVKRRFPLFNDYLTKLKKFDDYPNLAFCILVTWLMEEKMPTFYKSLSEKVHALDDYLENGKNESGKRTYEFLMSDGRRGRSKESLESELQHITKNVRLEMNEYENESEAYENRSIVEAGLITNDAVKCLKDFDGRTFPFLRTICAQIKSGDAVLEVGVGTGILSVASVISGAKKVIGVELNPVTCILAEMIVTFLEDNGAIPRKSIEIFWGDALKFGKDEYKYFRGKKFDTVISENIYTGMFFELQMKMLSHILRDGLVETKMRFSHGFFAINTTASVVPEGMSSCVELVELEGYDFKRPTEVWLDLKKKGVKMNALTKDHVYDQIFFKVDEPSDVVSVIKFKALRNGEVNAVNFYSAIRMMTGDYIDRNENKFLNNDSLLILDKPVQVKKGDIVIVGVAYNEGDSVKDVILEVRKLNPDGTVKEEYDARLNVSAAQHEKNIGRFKTKNKCVQPLNLSHLGDFVIVRSSSFRDGYENMWLSDIDYVNLKSYGS